MPMRPAAIASRLLTAGLPSFPRTVSRIEHLVLEAEAPPQAVASVIATDPSLALLVINQANAAGHATTQLTEAIRRIGSGVALSAARSAVPIDAAARSGLASCWAQANAVAVLLPLLIEQRRHRIAGRWDAETLHLIGLIHDLGHVLALAQFPDAYDRATARLRQGEPDLPALIHAELGATPAQLAALVAANWKLPPVLEAPMVHWRDPAGAGEYEELAALVQVAHVLVHAAGFTAAGDLYVPPIDDAVIARLDLHTPDCEAVLTKLFTSMDELELYEGALRG